MISQSPRTASRNITGQVELDHPHLYFNRELSWLDFCGRVLEQATDARNPLLERIRYLGYTASHLDEFFCKRVGGLKRQKLSGVRSLSPDGRTPQQQLALIRQAAVPLYQDMNKAWKDILRSAPYKKSQLRIRNYENLATHEQARLRAFFQEHIFPVLTPLAVDPGHPFPFISHLSLSVAILLQHSTRGTRHFARIKVPLRRGRWVALGDSHTFVPLDQVITHNLRDLFRGMNIISAHTFRITRNANLEQNQEEADDLTATLSDELRRRRFAPVVRLEVEKTMPTPVRKLLKRQLALDDNDIYDGGRHIGLSDCLALADVDLPSERYTAWEPFLPAAFPAATEMFTAIREKDHMVHHPYDSFAHCVLGFIETSAVDPHVQAIKQTLYRTAENSPILQALIRAAERGKQVTVVLEINARYDEERNLNWAQRLEKAGVTVHYGPRGLKTHAKTTLVLRREKNQLRTYCHISTGNYNTDTAEQYTDVGLFTCNPAIGADLTQLFHSLTGHARQENYRSLLLAPRHMRSMLTRLIQQEIQFQKTSDGKANDRVSHTRELQTQGAGGHIVATMTGLDDLEMIQQLYQASQAGVQVDIIVRGHCRLRPGLPGYSPTIRVMSIVGRFLENVRLLYFRNGGDPKVFIGSADWMRRNLDERIEILAPVQSPPLKQRLIKVLHRMLSETCHAWDLQAEGAYVRRQGTADDLYDTLLQEAQKDSKH